MPPQIDSRCALRDAVDALIAREASGADRERAEAHLAECEDCRQHFHSQTASRYPSIRDYTILGELGRGGFGVVYKALHHNKHRIEALKVLFGKTAQREAYFENEIRLVAALRHPNIATLFEANVSSPPFYYAMEYVDGRHLGAHLRTHNVPLERRIEFVKLVAEAVHCAHRQGVIHRDLKPQNILIGSSGQPHVVDFGIAKRLVRNDADAGTVEPASGSGGALGTYGYISPEQLAGHRVDARADVFSLGALLFHVATGQPARHATDAEHVRIALRERGVRRAEDLAAIIACAVQPAPELRYASCEVFARELDDYIAGRPIRARRDAPPGYRVARMAALLLRNHPVPVQVVAALLVAIALAHTFWYMGLRWSAPIGATDRVAMIAVKPSTVAAIRAGEFAHVGSVDAGQRKSWRSLYGHLMEVLADARPAAVIWDFKFPDAQPAHDAAFVRGVAALNVPVIVGTDPPDVNVEPVVAPDIRAAVHGWGTLWGTQARSGEQAVHVPLALLRGRNRPVPSLALAGFAAARRPDCDLDIRQAGDRLSLHYRRRSVGAGELRWPYDPDEVPVFAVDAIERSTAGMQPGDRVAIVRFGIEDMRGWGERAIALEDVLRADATARRAWFEGRAVLVGQMIPPTDLHPIGSGEWVFGAQCQAGVLEGLFRSSFTYRANRAGLAARLGAWCTLAALLAGVVVTRSRAWPFRASVVALPLLVGAIVLAAVLAQWCTTRWQNEAAIGVAAVLGGFGVGLWIRLLHRQQWQLAPARAWPDDPTSTTRLASPSGSTSGAATPSG